MGNRLERQLEGLLARRKSRNQFRRLTTVPPGTADFSSNGYLSLSSHPDIQREFLARLQSHVDTSRVGKPDGTRGAATLLGSGGSRLLDGNTELAEVLELRIANFHGAAAGLLFNSAMDANVGLFGCVPQPDDIIVYDELVHASVHDGMRLSRARKRIAFAHNRVFARVPEDKHQKSNGTRVLGSGAKPSLETVLQEIQESPDGGPIREGKGNVFVTVEGVYSMDGDLAPLADIVSCVEGCLPGRNGYIVVDEAHSTGILGPRGRGLVCELGLDDRIWARVLGFGKAMGCSGGIVLCSPTTRSYLVNYARTLIYTTFMAFHSLKSLEVAYDFLETGKSEALVVHLQRLVDLAYSRLVEICTRHRPPSTLFRLNQDRPKSPIIPLLTSHPRSLAEHCQQGGYMVRPIVAPTVPVGLERVRICLHAGNTIEEVEGLCSVIEAWVFQWKTCETGDAITSQNVDPGKNLESLSMTRASGEKARL